MGKKNRRNNEDKPKKKRVIIPFVERPFAGLDAEAELIALRELIPLGTIPARTGSEYGSEDILIASILPDMAGVMRREDGVLVVAVQTITNSGDASLDIADRIVQGLPLEPGETLACGELPAPDGPHLPDVIESFSSLEIHSQPTFWIAEDKLSDPEMSEALKQVERNVVPTVPVDSVNYAYWCRMSREFLRWLRPEPRDRVLDGLARLRARGEDRWEDGVRLIGAFRALGLSIPVWELAPGTEADELGDALKQFDETLTAAIASDEPLSADEKRARAGLVSRQVTIR